jgi:hypothetical protein
MPSEPLVPPILWDDRPAAMPTRVLVSPASAKPMNTNLETKTRSAPTADPLPAWLKMVRERVTGLRFGTVQIVVHEGRVTQIESIQRTRVSLDESAAA